MASFHPGRSGLSTGKQKEEGFGAGTQPPPAATAGTWLEKGDANTSRRERRLLEHRTAALCSLRRSWGPAPGNFPAPRGNRGNRAFSSVQRKDALIQCVNSRPDGSPGAWSLLAAPLPSPHGR